MTRSEAIREIIETWQQRDREFCGTESEERHSAEAIKEVLTALGVTEAELPDSTRVEVSTGDMPMYSFCPVPGCFAKPRLHESGKWWECGSGQPHFCWAVQK